MCFQGVFPYALSGYALWTLPIFEMIRFENSKPLNYVTVIAVNS